MGPRQRTLRLLEDTGVVAVLRVDDATGLLDVSRALQEGGVNLVEITMTVPDALDVIAEASRALGEDVLIGAGTTLDAVTARLAALAGASFIVSPMFDPEVLEMAHTYDLLAMPGCLTPTEIVTAWKSGADVIKVFPGRLGTPSYFQDLRGPLPQIRLMPTGNVDLSTAGEYIKAGAMAVGVGKAMVPQDAVRRRDFVTITHNARSFRAVVDQARGERS